MGEIIKFPQRIANESEQKNIMDIIANMTIQEAREIVKSDEEIRPMSLWTWMYRVEEIQLRLTQIMTNLDKVESGTKMSLITPYLDMDFVLSLPEEYYLKSVSVSEGREGFKKIETLIKEIESKVKTLYGEMQR